MQPSDYHIPVLAGPSIEGIGVSQHSDGVFVDATFGGGGHSKLILNEMSDHGRLFGFDQDADAHQNVFHDARFTLIPENFRHIRNFLRLQGIRKIDGLLADLGVSSHQFDEAGRGFSIRFDAPLDMRMNQQNNMTAADVIASYSVSELTRMFRTYGELKRPDLVAHAIDTARRDRTIANTGDLIQVTNHLAPKGKENQFHAQVFQAIRIEVNDELEALKTLLEASVDLIKEGGRLVIISYHSLEDRLVKHFIRSGNFNDEIPRDFKGQALRPYEPIQSKAIVPDDDELGINPRSRSARLRVATRTGLSAEQIKTQAA